jgi:uncharacterized lipoprotein YajG
MQKNNPDTNILRQALFAFAALFMLAACEKRCQVHLITITPN